MCILIKSPPQKGSLLFIYHILSSTLRPTPQCVTQLTKDSLKLLLHKKQRQTSAMSAKRTLCNDVFSPEEQLRRRRRQWDQDGFNGFFTSIHHFSSRAAVSGWFQLTISVVVIIVTLLEFAHHVCS